MNKRPGEKIRLMSVEQLLGVPEGDSAQEIDINKIHGFANHPFKVVDDDKMHELVESILGNGVLTPVLVRLDGDGNYEMISGHRRLHAAKEAGLDTIPAIVRELSDDEATIVMVDSNLQREKIFPSEKAFAYKMRYEAMRRSAGRPRKNVSQGGTNFREVPTSAQSGTKLRADEELALQVGESRNQVHRFLRLAELIPELLDLIDKDKIAIMTGVDLSYLPVNMQQWIFEYIKENGVVKSYQIIALRHYLENAENVTQKDVFEVLNENLPSRLPSHRVALTEKQLKKYFPAHYTEQEMRAVIEKLLEKWKKEQEKSGTKYNA